MAVTPLRADVTAALTEPHALRPLGYPFRWCTKAAGLWSASGEVVPLFDVLDEVGVDGLPAQKFLGGRT
jgi:hypothetical protein